MQLRISSLTEVALYKIRRLYATTVHTLVWTICRTPKEAESP